MTPKVRHRRAPARSWLWVAGLLLALLGVVAAPARAIRLNMAPATCDPPVLVPVSTDPSRAHRVAEGDLTTYVLLLSNPGPPAAAQVSLAAVTLGWEASLAEAGPTFLPVGPGAPTLDFPLLQTAESRFIVLTLAPGPGIAPGQTATVDVIATLSNGLAGCDSRPAVLDNQPKVYLVSVDGLPPGYLNLNRLGQPDPDPDLMPSLRNFLAGAAWFPAARASLPAGTDMNVFAALSGAWPGTSGIPTVGIFLRGWDEDGQIVFGGIAPEDLRYGAAGDPVPSIFDLAQDPAYGGDPDRFTVFLTGKFQLAYLFQSATDSRVDILVDGYRRPGYVPAPQPYRLGDPFSDPDAAADRDGVNVFPLSEFHLHPEGKGLYGDNPLRHPEDRWIAASAVQILAAEDPDVLVAHFGGVDLIHHAAGTADIPSEWRDRGTPMRLWDDLSVYTPRANRDPVMDVVHELDQVAGFLLQALTSRGADDSALVGLCSDHGGTTYFLETLDLEAIVAGLGVAESVRRVDGLEEIAYLYLWDPADVPLVESALEAYEITHPLWGTTVAPFLVLDQAEMDAGSDGATGRFGRDGGPLRGEVYSEWLIDYPVDDNSKVIWPDLLVFTRYHFGITNLNNNLHEDVIGGHAGLRTTPVLLGLRGPGVVPGAYTVADTSLVDLAPTLYHLLGWASPGSVDGRVLHEALAPP